MKVLVAQLCLTLGDPMDCTPPGSSVHGILQARTLEWVAISSSRESSWPKDQTWVPALQADSLLSEPPGKPIHTHTHTHTHTHILQLGVSEVRQTDLNHHSQLLWVVVVYLLSHVGLFSTLWTVARLLCPWDFPGKNTRLACHFLLRGIFPSQGLNPHFLHGLGLGLDTKQPGRLITSLIHGQLRSLPGCPFFYL